MLVFVNDDFVIEYAALKKTVEQLQRKLENVNGEGVSNDRSSVSFSPAGSSHPVLIPADLVMLAQLTDQDDDDDRLYAWSQVRATETGYELVDNGAQGTVNVDLPSSPAFDIRDDEASEDLTDSTVVMAKGFYTRSVPDGNGGIEIKAAVCWYVISYPESVGSLSGQVKQIGFSAHRAVWQMIQANAPLT